MNVLVTKLARFTCLQSGVFAYDSDWCIMAYAVLIINALWFSVKTSHGKQAINTSVCVTPHPSNTFLNVKKQKHKNKNEVTQIKFFLSNLNTSSHTKEMHSYLCHLDPVTQS